MQKKKRVGLYKGINIWLGLLLIVLLLFLAAFLFANRVYFFQKVFEAPSLQMSPELPSLNGGVVFGCAKLKLPGLYYLSDDINTAEAGVCFNISTSDIVFDCQGHTILEEAGRTVFFAANVKNITITNCILESRWNSQACNTGEEAIINNFRGIQFNNVSYSAINNTFIYADEPYLQRWGSGGPHGVFVFNSSNLIITNTKIRNLAGGGFELFGSNFNTFYNDSASNNVYNFYMANSSNNYISVTIDNVPQNTSHCSYPLYATYEGMLILGGSNNNTIDKINISLVQQIANCPGCMIDSHFVVQKSERNRLINSVLGINGSLTHTRVSYYDAPNSQIVNSTFPWNEIDVFNSSGFDYNNNVFDGPGMNLVNSSNSYIRNSINPINLAAYIINSKNVNVSNMTNAVVSFMNSSYGVITKLNGRFGFIDNSNYNLVYDSNFGTSGIVSSSNNEIKNSVGPVWVQAGSKNNLIHDLNGGLGVILSNSSNNQVWNCSGGVDVVSGAHDNYVHDINNLVNVKFGASHNLFANLNNSLALFGANYNFIANSTLFHLGITSSNNNQFVNVIINGSYGTNVFGLGNSSNNSFDNLRINGSVWWGASENDSLVYPIIGNKIVNSIITGTIVMGRSARQNVIANSTVTIPSYVQPVYLLNSFGNIFDSNKFSGWTMARFGSTANVFVNNTFGSSSILYFDENSTNNILCGNSAVSMKYYGSNSRSQIYLTNCSNIVPPPICVSNCSGKCGGVSDGCGGTCDNSCGNVTNSCGDGVCNNGESCLICPQDCGICGCTPNLKNTTWSGWMNVSCLSSGLMNQSRSLVQYDTNNCGIANNTISEYRAVENCTYTCTPSCAGRCAGDSDGCGGTCTNSCGGGGGGGNVGHSVSSSRYVNRFNVSDYAALNSTSQTAIAGLEETAKKSSRAYLYDLLFYFVIVLIVVAIFVVGFKMLQNFRNKDYVQNVRVVHDKSPDF